MASSPRKTSSICNRKNEFELQPEERARKMSSICDRKNEFHLQLDFEAANEVPVRQISKRIRWCWIQ
jgi:hypothetical protein